MPATPPTAIHTRWSAPWRMRVTSQSTSTQASRSNVVVLKMWVTARTTAATAEHTAARTRALGVPPRCFASEAINRTTTIPATTDGTRNARGDDPNAAWDSRPSRGVSGGWST